MGTVFFWWDSRDSAGWWGRYTTTNRDFATEYIPYVLNDDNNDTHRRSYKRIKIVVFKSTRYCQSNKFGFTKITFFNDTPHDI